MVSCKKKKEKKIRKGVEYKIAVVEFTSLTFGKVIFRVVYA